MTKTAPVYLDGRRKAKLGMPLRLSSSRNFDQTVLRARSVLTGAALSKEPLLFLDWMYYLLGWFVGDLGKHFENESQMTASVDIHLSRVHPENLLLGEYVAERIRALGIHCSRGKDREPDRGSPYGAYRWNSGSSGLFGWFHKVCLGLGWHERASWTPVKMDWILAATERQRQWFLRGLADSDGDVHFRDKSVDITTSPNTGLVKALCDSLGIHNRIRLSARWSQVTIPADRAASISIFNPDVESYRKKILDRLTKADTYERHWPAWLQDKVELLARSGLSKREICEQLLLEDNTYIKMYTLSRKMKSGQIRISKGSAGRKKSAEGGIRAVGVGFAPPTPRFLNPAQDYESHPFGLAWCHD